MLAVLLVLLAIVLFGFGFTVKVLWYAAIIALLLAVISFFARSSA